MTFTKEQREEVKQLQERVGRAASSLRKMYDREERLTDNTQALTRLDLSNAADAIDAASQALKRVLARQPE
jgi:hypothetical protein